MAECPKCKRINTMMKCKKCNTVWCKECKHKEGFKVINQCPNCGGYQIETFRG